MKKAALIILGLIVVLLGAAFILPIVYKDEIRAKIDQEIAKSVDANVYFNDFGVSLFRHFPNVTASLEDFGVVGKGDFKGDTLAAAQSFEITVNLMSLIGGDGIKVKTIDLMQPRIYAKVLKNGNANWDIYIDSGDSTAADTASSDFAFRVDSWQVTDGYVVYEDQTMPMFVKINKLNHRGSGDFTQDIFDMATNTQMEGFSFAYDGIQYLTNKRLTADMDLNMNLPESRYTFKNNTFALNDFKFGFDGFVAIPDTNITVDITYQAKENNFKNLLSLVPGVYSESFQDLKADGSVAFNGYVKGTYNAVQMPGYGVNLLVKEGTMKYASLPTSVNNINVDMKVDNPTGDLSKLLVDIKKFHADLGKNPIDGRVRVQGLDPYNIDANILAKLNLAELTQMFPMEGMTLRGLYNLDLKAKGTYSDTLKKMPAINANMRLQNGYVKSKEFPAPLEQINFTSKVTNASGQMADTKVWVNNFNMRLEGEPLQANAYVENFDDYTYDVKVKGILDLTKLTKIYPLEGMTLAGRINADIATKGKMSDVEAERYDQLPTSGSMQVNNLVYESADLPQGMRITTASMDFTPQQINLSKMEGFVGKSDISVSGSLSNYMAYLFREGQTIRGNMSFNSKQFDVNEWMTDDTTATEDTTSLTVFEVPKNIDFTLISSINKVLYDNMTLSNMVGTVIVRDGAVRMDQLAFNSLGGNFVMNGAYDTKDVSKPTFDFDLDINQVAVSEAYKTFNTVQVLMPLAKNITGNFSTDFKIAGGLGQDMMPLYNTLTGGGVITLINAVVKDAPILSNLSSFTKLKDLETIKINDVKLQADVKDGRIHFQPFDVNAGKYQMNIAGSNGIDGSLDYTVKMDIPAGQVGATINTALASLTGKEVANAETLKLNLNVGGTYAKPKIGLLGSSTSGTATAKQAVTAAVKEKVTAEVDKAKAEAEAKARAEADRLKAEAETKIKAEQERIRLEAEAKKKALEEQAKKKIEEEKNKLKNRLFGQPKKDTTTKN